MAFVKRKDPARPAAATEKAFLKRKGRKDAKAQKALLVRLFNVEDSAASVARKSTQSAMNLKVYTAKKTGMRIPLRPRHNAKSAGRKSPSPSRDVALAGQEMGERRGQSLKRGSPLGAELRLVTHSPCHLVIFLLLLLAAPSAAFAHRLDEYLQATLVAIEPGAIRLEMNLTPGVQVVDQVLARIDSDHDGAISAQEAVTYAEALKRDLTVRLDRRVLELNLTAVHLPEPDELREGEGIIQLEFSATPDRLRAGAHSLTIENRHLPAVSVYLLNAAKPKADAIEITGQKRNETQSAAEIEFTFHPRPNPYAAVGIDALLVALFVGGMAWEWRAVRKRSRV